jgi:hypothetical protein
MDGTVLSTSGSGGFTTLWNSRCSHESGERDITSAVEDILKLSAKRLTQ